MFFCAMKTNIQNFRVTKYDMFLFEQEVVSCQIINSQINTSIIIKIKLLKISLVEIICFVLIELNKILNLAVNEVRLIYSVC